jgi:hypothetical protein
MTSPQRDGGAAAPPGARPAAWIAAALVAASLAAAVRQYLACPSYWYDEAYVLLNVFERSGSDLLGAIDHQVVCPPLYLLTLRGLYLVLGPAEWAMRLPALVAEVAALLVLIPLARRLVGSPGWVFALALQAGSYHAFMHSCEVRQYTGDLFFTELIVLAAWTAVAPAGSPRGRSWGLAALLAAAGVAPWYSFASPFVLGGASLALLLDALRRRSRAAWAGWLAFNGVAAASGLCLWWLHARHLYYPGLRHHWSQGFPDAPGAGAAAVWLLKCAIRIGDYGTTGMGVPLLVLGAVGLWVLGRRTPALPALVLGPFILAAAACFGRRYPLDDRTAFFLVPCLWLAAAAGLGALLARLPRRAGLVAVSLAALALVPDALRVGKQMVAVEPRAEYREAFAYVRGHWATGDALWVLHPEVYAVYYGGEAPPLDSYSPTAAVRRAVEDGRLWVICPPGARASPETFQFLHDHAAGPVAYRRLAGLEIALYTAPTGAGLLGGRERPAAPSPSIGVDQQDVTRDEE